VTHQTGSGATMTDLLEPRRAAVSGWGVAWDVLLPKRAAVVGFAIREGRIRWHPWKRSSARFVRHA
jgi:hypothetical protein